MEVKIINSIVYKSNTGFTEKYAKMLPEENQKMINIFKSGGNFISKDNLKDIINWHKEKQLQYKFY